MADVSAVVLAAGTASRYRAADPTARSKLLAPVRGKALVRHAVDAALASRARPVVVVTGHAREAVEAALGDAAVRVVFNPLYEDGLSTSLRAGVTAVPEGTAGVLVLLGDMPLVTADLLDRLIGAFEARPDAAAVAPVFGGQRGNPVLLSRALFPAVARLTGDAGARKLLAGIGGVLDVEVDNHGVMLDVDTPDALAQFGQQPG